MTNQELLKPSSQVNNDFRIQCLPRTMSIARPIHAEQIMTDQILKTLPIVIEHVLTTRANSSNVI